MTTYIKQLLSRIENSFEEAIELEPSDTYQYGIDGHMAAIQDSIDELNLFMKTAEWFTRFSDAYACWENHQREMASEDQDADFSSLFAEGDETDRRAA